VAHEPRRRATQPQIGVEKVLGLVCVERRLGFSGCVTQTITATADLEIIGRVRLERRLGIGGCIAQSSTSDTDGARRTVSVQPSEREVFGLCSVDVSRVFGVEVTRGYRTSDCEEGATANSRFGRTFWL
jgi:hypothetical protein